LQQAAPLVPEGPPARQSDAFCSLRASCQLSVVPRRRNCSSLFAGLFDRFSAQALRDGLSLFFFFFRSLLFHGAPSLSGSRVANDVLCAAAVTD